VKGVTVPEDSPKPMQIGEIAERSGMSIRTLRHYDQIGLLTPSARSDGGFRLYTEDDLDRLMVIRRMKPLGYSLEDMHGVMTLLLADGGVDDQEWRAVLEEATRRRAELARQVEMADEFLDLLTGATRRTGRQGSTSR
jgi:MerR family transcriptional regulator, copper efflux regulator